MLSDWHVGTGAGRPGSIDKLLARDADGFPYVPAKTVNGIWRDAMETLTLGLDGGNDGAWSKWVEEIFGIQPNQLQGVQPNETQAHELQRRVKKGRGTYSFSLLAIQPARMSQNFRGHIDKAVNAVAGKEEQKRQRRRILSALTFIKPGVAINEQTGTAATDFLRFEEMGRAGTVLEAECELNLEKAEPEAQKTIWYLLLLSAQLVERVGGKRRRGAGLCKLKIVDCNDSQITEAINHLKEKQKEQGAATQQTESSDKKTDVAEIDQRSIIREASKNERAEGAIENENVDGWQTLEFSLHLQTPISIVTATLGNVSEALDYVPGTYLLPHITKVLREKLGDKVFQAVAYGDLQILPAMIEINNARGLPVPKAIYYDKVGGGFNRQKFDEQKKARSTVYNLFTEPVEIKMGEQKKSYRSGYISSLNENGKKLPTYKNKPKTLLMHNTVKDDIQRPHEDVGGVYSREAIAAGTCLRGEIRLKKSLASGLDANWWTELNGSVRLGISRKDDYGLAKLHIWLKEQKGENKNGDSKANSEKGSNSKLTVYLESDMLLRNANLRQTNLVEDLKEVLENELAVTLSNPLPLIHTRRIESWHEGWGFPRPTLIAMAAGSCVVFEVDGNSTVDKLHDKLQEVEARGVGERRGEGYGRVRFNPPLLTEKINGWMKAENLDDTKLQTNGAANNLSDEEKRFAELIEEAAWREELKVAVLKIADDLQKRKKIFAFDSEHSEPPMSQVGGLRSAISRLQEEKDATVVIAWLEHLKSTSKRRDRWAKNKDEAEAKLNKIKKLLENKSRKQKPDDEPQNVWEWLEGPFKAPLTLVRSKEDLQKKFWAEAVRSLFDACARAHKRELEKKGGN
jgi:CRISPR-associated protein Csx10